MKTRGFALLAFCAACAPATSTIPVASAPRDPTRIERYGSVTEIEINSRARAMDVTLTGDPAEHWPALIAAYNRMELPATGFDSVSFTIQVDGVERRRTLGGEPISRWLDCGRIPVSNRLAADVYPVVITLASQLQPRASGATTLRSTVRGRTRNPTTSDGPISCVSTGLLEKRIEDAVRGTAASG